MSSQIGMGLELKGALGIRGSCPREWQKSALWTGTSVPRGLPGWDYGEGVIRTVIQTRGWSQTIY